ncbi:hypothetical protein QYF36_012050 [Acer negundo]|nr:hypothetical protein QYF36_012050 [Acer negundo]
MMMERGPCGTLLGFMNSDSNENHVTRFSQSRVPSQPSLSTYGNVVTFSSEVGMILPPVMVSSGNSSYTVMEVPYGVKSLKVPDGNLGP